MTPPADPTASNSLFLASFKRDVSVHAPVPVGFRFYGFREALDHSYNDVTNKQQHTTTNKVAYKGVVYFSLKFYLWDSYNCAASYQSTNGLVE